MAVEVHPAKAVRQTPYQRWEAAAARTQEKANKSPHGCGKRRIPASIEKHCRTQPCDPAVIIT